MSTLKLVQSTLLSILCFFNTNAQTKRSFPLTADHWNAIDGEIEFVDYKNSKVVRSTNDGFYNIMLEGFEFTTGTIEYDVELTGTGFPGINFRIDEDTLNSEVFYLRHFGKPDPLRRTTMQYAAVIDGVNLWDITDEYQAGALIKEDEWNHIKLIISENQLLAYVNDMDQPALHIPKLEGVSNKGAISLSGNVIYANMEIQPNEIGDLSNKPGFDPTSSDPNYIRSWKVSDPIELPIGKDVMMRIPFNPGVAVDTNLLTPNTKWQDISAGPRSLVNLTTIHGNSNEVRRLTWLRTTIESEQVQSKLMQLGFQDEVWVFINGQPLHFDKNYYGSPSMKEPIGRCTLDNTSFEIPFQEGTNEVLIGVANYFFAWGIIARLEDTAGLKY